MIYHLFITPIEYILDCFFSVSFKIFGIEGIAIICVSIVVQVLVLPLYNRSDSIQEKERNKQKSMEKWLNHIRKTFSGNERFMMTQAYYKEQNYRPIFALKGSISLLLQIPFFIAAYHFLSNLEGLNGASFVFLSDLSKPDALFCIGNFNINVMPIIMTVINVLSSIIYSNGFSKKEKIQLYGMAFIFLALLYNSPSGLVLYWTMNNVFSLCKNIITKCFQNPRRVVSIICASGGISLFLIASLGSGNNSVKVRILFSCLLILSFFPLLFLIFKRKNGVNKQQIAGRLQNKECNTLFLLTSLFLALFIGAVIPFSVVTSSPAEFIVDSYNPIRLIADVLLVSVGLFVIWNSIFYHLCTEKIKIIIVSLLFGMAAIIVIDFFFFGNDLGILSSLLKYEKEPSFSLKAKVLNLILVFIVFSLCSIGCHFFLRFFKYLMFVFILSSCLMSVMSGIKVINGTKEARKNQETGLSNDSMNHKILPISQDGKNVVVLMLDRAINGYIPFILNEKAELRDAFKDFIYYPNSLSFGCHTNLGAPALFGGYEYTPYEINLRTDMKLVDKHNEALSVLPVLFSQNGWCATVCDPPYAGYSVYPDLSIYDKWKNINAYHLYGNYASAIPEGSDPEMVHDKQIRNMFFYSIMKGLPLFLQIHFYDDGKYWSSSQLMSNGEYIDSSSVLFALSSITNISKECGDSFVMIQNDTPHTVYPLSYPDYSIPEKESDWIPGPEYRISENGNKLLLSNDTQIEQYDTNIISLLYVARWINFLKENDAYDNTRIIIVADHGYPYGQFDYMLLPNGVDVQAINPLLMVKDYDTHYDSIVTSMEFMTNADVPVIAVSGLIEEPHNPFTGVEINDNKKKNGPQFVTMSHNFGTSNGNEYVFDTSDGKWFKVHDSIFNIDNWDEISL